MKKYIFTTALLIFGTLSMVHAGEHKAGADNSCFYDSNRSKGKWDYFFCGKRPGDNKCAGKKCGGKNNLASWFGSGDSCIDKRDHETFTFGTGAQESYCCCGGTDEKAGKFVKAVHKNDCYTNDAPTEEIKPLSNGQACKKLTYKTVCGGTVTKDCDTAEPQICATGYIWRNGECIPLCTGDTVYESAISNTCALCETTAYQGISKDKTFCKKCDKDTEFFDRQTKECIKKSNLKQYPKKNMKKCWRCPRDLYNTCVQTLTTNGNTAAFKEKCHLED